MAALHRSGARLLATLDRWSRTRYWRPAATGVILLAALFVAFPSLDSVGGGTWDSVQAVGAQPFTDLGFASDSHASKNLYRLTVSVPGEAVGLSPAGYMVVQALFGVLMIFALLVVLERATQDRVTAFLLTLTACMTYPGVVAFVEVRGIFDAVALALLIVALAWPRPPIIAPLVFLAGWTDERALFASGFLVAVFWFERSVDQRRSGGAGAGDRRTSQIVAVFAGVLAYGASRIAVVVAFDLPQETGGVGPSILLDQLNNLAVGLWTGLEGLWIALALAVFLLFRAQLRLLALFVVAVTGVISVFAVSVLDITRSMGYLLPSIVLSALVLGTMLPRRTVRRVALVCLSLSVLWPVYYVAARTTISWHYPLPVQLVRMLIGAGD